MRGFFIGTAAALVLAGCAKEMVWVRTDGQLMTGNPALTQQAQIDMTICQGERQKADLSGVTVAGGGFDALSASISRGVEANQVAAGCMAQKGYVQVPREQAEATRTQFAATAVARGVAPPASGYAAIAPPPLPPSSR